MTEPDVPPMEIASLTPAVGEADKVPWSQWALAILLTTLVGLSAAALLVATIMELLFDSASAWVRFAVLLPVLLIASYLLVQLWQKLIYRHKPEKK